MYFSVFVEGRPLAQKRPRTYQSGKTPGHTRTRTVSNTGSNRAWQNLIRKSVKEAWMKMGNPEPMSDVSCLMTFIMPHQKKAMWGSTHTSRPDIDNLAKLVMDALQPGKTDTTWKGAVSDDGTIHTLTVRKIYGEVPGVDIYLEDPDA